MPSLVSTPTKERTEEAAPTPAPRQARPRLRGWGHWVSVAWFLVPALVLFLVFVLAPIVVAVFTGFFKWGGVGPMDDFVGFANYTKLFDDQVFLGDLGRGLYLIVLSITVQLPFALLTAVLLNQKLRGRAVYRMLFFAPYILSEVVTAVLFTMIFLPGAGMADHLAGLLGLEGLRGTWLADPSTVMPTLFVVMIWKYFGFHMMLFLAGLQSIPTEILEAASIDGAGPWQRFRHVTLPLLGPTIRISVFLSIIGSIQLFDLVWVMTAGGPNHSSETMAIAMFQFGFKRYQVGYASAISVVLFMISLVFSLFYQRYVLRRDLSGAVTSGGAR
ncbi:carbohydrate ABC transporter permease [Streptomyces venezuelae]|uniref:Maltose or maltodextrin ABC transporter, permease protein MalF n=1 Tax=Streptomyces venezuelae (strain ATCC 10712 / CBS 650.69 / DSM 40230 / JCM 4526 / NBRC 13096 / PD 04745) TaxID=953739 RepID=F2RHS9_STRVP|nr:sugar ABC transporter permease [Streptomyces venezuelae ATCC 10712]CCA60023.1 Maltose or maltodextrin ABC transporter, permease protein MalF [Streptomyces venezuelae ATCC 10712]